LPDDIYWHRARKESQLDWGPVVMEKIRVRYLLLGAISGLCLAPAAGAASKENVLYSFGAAPDGSTPTGSLAFDTAGNLYGTTDVGGGPALARYSSFHRRRRDRRPGLKQYSTASRAATTATGPTALLSSILPATSTERQPPGVPPTQARCSNSHRPSRVRPHGLRL
jgi:hypothetical protein